jgi:hypothetical protein
LALKIIWEMLLYSEYTDYKEMLKDLYLNKRWGMERIGDHLGINKIVVRKALVNDCNVEIRPKGRPKFIRNVVKMSKLIDSSCATFATMTIIRRAFKK